MNSGQAAEKLQIDSIDAVPQLELETYEPDDPDDACPSNPSWRNSWSAEFRRNRWVKTEAQPTLTLRHFFYCSRQGVVRLAPGYIRIFDDLALRESNGVFALNGRVFRKPVTLFTSHRMMTALPDNLPGVLQGFIPESIREFRMPSSMATRRRLQSRPCLCG